MNPCQHIKCPFCKNCLPLQPLIDPPAWENLYYQVSPDIAGRNNTCTFPSAVFPDLSSSIPRPTTPTPVTSRSAEPPKRKAYQPRRLRTAPKEPIDLTTPSIRNPARQTDRKLTQTGQRERPNFRTEPQLGDHLVPDLSRHVRDTFSQYKVPIWPLQPTEGGSLSQQLQARYNPEQPYHLWTRPLIEPDSTGKTGETIFSESDLPNTPQTDIITNWPINRLQERLDRLKQHNWKHKIGVTEPILGQRQLERKRRAELIEQADQTPRSDNSSTGKVQIIPEKVQSVVSSNLNKEVLCPDIQTSEKSGTDLQNSQLLKSQASSKSGNRLIERRSILKRVLGDSQKPEVQVTKVIELQKSFSLSDLKEQGSQTPRKGNCESV